MNHEPPKHVGFQHQTSMKVKARNLINCTPHKWMSCKAPPKNLLLKTFTPEKQYRQPPQTREPENPHIYKVQGPEPFEPYTPQIYED